MDENKLEEDIQRGNSALHAWNNFIAEYINGRRNLLLKEIQSVPIDDVENIITIRRYLDTLNDMENHINSIIDTGKFARMTLNEE